MPWPTPGSVRYTSCRHWPRSRWLRCAGSPPFTAHAPIAMRILQFARNSRSTWTFSALQMPPSTMPMSHGPQCLMSVSGERSNSTRSSSANSRSSMSSSDMWQPKQPASEVVATLSLRRVTSVMVSLQRARRVGERLCADRGLVEAAPADRRHEPDALAQDRAHRADVDGLVGDLHVRVGEPARLGVHDQVLAEAAAGEREDVLAVHLARRAHAQLAEDAAVELEQDLGVGSVH